MYVIIKSVNHSSPAYKAGVRAGDTLVSLDKNEIMDVLDYRFYQQNERLTLEYINSKGKIKSARIKKKEHDEL